MNILFTMVINFVSGDGKLNISRGDNNCYFDQNISTVRILHK